MVRVSGIYGFFKEHSTNVLDHVVNRLRYDEMLVYEVLGGVQLAGGWVALGGYTSSKRAEATVFFLLRMCPHVA